MLQSAEKIAFLLLTQVKEISDVARRTEASLHPRKSNSWSGARTTVGPGVGSAVGERAGSVVGSLVGRDVGALASAAALAKGNNKDDVITSPKSQKSAFLFLLTALPVSSAMIKNSLPRRP